jgi:hypothetical protein
MVAAVPQGMHNMREGAVTPLAYDMMMLIQVVGAIGAMMESVDIIWYGYCSVVGQNNRLTFVIPRPQI